MVTKFVLLFLLTATILFKSTESATNKVVCYHGSWSTYRSGNGRFTVEDIDPTLCTHIIYSFVGINSDGSIRILDPNLEISQNNLNRFNALKSRNANLKTLVAIGGWNEGSVTFSTVAASPSLRAAFIQSALNFVQTYGFDGFDLDWEYPAQRGGASVDKSNFALLLQEFRTEFDKYGLLLTAAVAATSGSVDLSYDVPSLSKYLDVINVMAYDFHGSWDGVTGQNAPLYASSLDSSSEINVDAAISGWIARGADPQKIALGLGVYGRSYTLTSANNRGLGASISAVGNPGPYTAEGGMLGYNEICELQLQGGWTVSWDDEQKVPYASKGTQWVGYDDPQSVDVKVKYAISKNLGGIMIWSIETEDFRGTCGTKYPILNAINSALGTTNNVDGADVVVDDNNNNESATTKSVKTTTTTSKPSESAPSSGTSDLCTSTGYVRDPSDCSAFYYCLASGKTFIPLRQQCVTGLYFNAEKSVCDWPSAVQC